jgi:hypothetical protein
MSNVLHLGDVRELNLYQAWDDTRADETLWFLVVVRGLQAGMLGDLVLVEATDEAMERHLIDRKHLVPYGWLREPRPSKSGLSEHAEPSGRMPANNPKP